VEEGEESSEGEWKRITEKVKVELEVLGVEELEVEVDSSNSNIVDKHRNWVVVVLVKGGYCSVSSISMFTM
jgi:hypothetical protein